MKKNYYVQQKIAQNTESTDSKWLSNAHKFVSIFCTNNLYIFCFNCNGNNSEAVLCEPHNFQKKIMFNL